jgi:hypothetical protein
MKLLLTVAARPCKTIVEACLSAGVIQQSATREVMFQRCVKPIVTGKSIAGVNIDSATIDACKAKIAEAR